MIIRPMEPTELDLVVNVFEYYRDEANITDEQWNLQHVVKTIKNYSITWGLFFRVAFEGSRPVGVIGGFVTEDPITGERASAIQFCYLKPDYADVGNYRQLIDAFVEWSKTVEATSFKCLDIGNNPDRLLEVYESIGITPLPIEVYGKEIR